MIIHRLLDVFFKTLDTVDAVRDRVDRVRGKAPEPDPWAVEWPPPEADLPKQKSSANDDDDGEIHEVSTRSSAAPEATKKVGAKKKPKSNRKGSVDKVGKDLESQVAVSILGHLKSNGKEVITEDGDYSGKKVLARVLWALDAADRAGVANLSTADISALLHSAGGYEVFSTNVGRACRDHGDLIEVASAQGRSKTYRLTDEGKAAAKTLPKRAL